MSERKGTLVGPPKLAGKPQRHNKKRKHDIDASSRISQSSKRKRAGSAEDEATRSAIALDASHLSENDYLLEEIRALGGDEDDLALIGDVSSDSEHEGDGDTHQSVDAGLQEELQALAAQLGFQPLRVKGVNEKTPVTEVPSKSKADAERLSETHASRQATRLPAASTHAQTVAETRVDAHSMKLPQSGSTKQFKIEPRPDWHQVNLPPLPQASSSDANMYSGAIENLQAHAHALLEIDAEAYSKSVLAASSHKFLSTIMSTGTLSDKVSALTLAVQESPIHNVKAFDTLMSLASKRSRGQAIGALGALVDLLGPGLILPNDRRLRAFRTQPGLLGSLQAVNIRRWSPAQRLPGSVTEAHLISWVYEDWLKATYFKIIQLLEIWCNDEIEYSRIRSLDFVYALLKEKPEQETNLLRLIVNKLGDRDRKISSRSSYLLLQLQNSHPGMKSVIVQAIEQEVLLRPGQSSRARYYAVATLNQTILSQKDPQTAESLLRVYFDIFLSLLRNPKSGKDESGAADQETQPISRKRQKTGSKRISNDPSPEKLEQSSDEKLVSAVLTGINRATPFVSTDDPIIAHSSNFNTSIQALILIQQLSVSRHLAFDRFYRTLYESLLDPRLVTSSKQALYLNLVLRSLKADVDTRRVKAFVKRMLQILGLHQPSFACGILYVVLQLRRQYPDLRTLLEEPEDTDPVMGQVSGNGEPVPVTSYDGRKRDPEHSNAQHSCLWEIAPFLQHFHPSVSVIAESVLANDPAVQKPDLESHSLIRFLDKFVYRNPKVTEPTRGASIMQPVGKKAPGPATSLNHPTFWNKRIDQVAADEIFFHHYFQQAGKPAQDSSNGITRPVSTSDDEDEDEIWKALTTSHPDGPIDDSEDSGFEMGDFEEDDDDLVELGGDDDKDSLGNRSSDDIFSEDDMSQDSDASGIEEKTVDSGETKADRRKRLKALPTFASVEDYAGLLQAEDDM